MSRELCRKIVANVRAMFDDLPDDGQGPLVVLGQGEYAREVGGRRIDPKEVGVKVEVELSERQIAFAGSIGDKEVSDFSMELTDNGIINVSCDDNLAYVDLSPEHAAILAKWLQEAAR